MYNQTHGQIHENTADATTAQINMLKQQCRTWGIVNPDILTLLIRLSREPFVPERYRQLAFSEALIPLGHGQTMLTPREEAKIIDSLAVQSTERVFEIGTGSGYLTALLASLAKQVETIDIFEDFTHSAEKKLYAHQFYNVIFKTGDGLSALQHHKTQFDIIVFTGALPALPKHFLSHLTLGGRLFAFIGKSPAVQATWVKRTTQDCFETAVLFDTDIKHLLHYQDYFPEKFIF